jgi:deoxycytidine triphosphate deaminase
LYLSDRDLEAAISIGQLIVDPFDRADPTSIDLHLDSVDQAKIWDSDAIAADNKQRGNPGNEVHICRMNFREISGKHLIAPPTEKEAQAREAQGIDTPVFKRDSQVVLKRGGFLLWQTKETVGTPLTNPNYICFIDGKSTKTARTGLVVHLTAPTIHAGWAGKITLEMVNFGPFDIVLHEGDSVAQIVVARLTSVPQQTMAAAGSTTLGQTDVTGTAN